MILKGSQRGGAADLANHLMKDENDHVLVHEVSGFASDNLHDAFKEADALSRGTRCKQFLFSLSINPPADKNLSTEQFIAAIDKAEAKLGLIGQPRAIVFHEKLTAENTEQDAVNRRHAHAVWSRIDTDEMKAIRLSHSKLKLLEVSRELHIEHGIKMPDGLADRSKSDTKAFTFEEWQQAQRFGHDPRERKAAIQDAWAISDNKEAFTHALEERGYVLAKGDKRSFVVLDRDMEVHSLARQIGIKAKDVKARLGDPEGYQGVDDAKAIVASRMIETVSRIETERENQEKKRIEEQRLARQKLVEEQRLLRADAFKRMEEEQRRAANDRQARFRGGVGGLWDKMSGEHMRIQQLNEREAWDALQRDQKRRDELILSQQEERERLRAEHQRAKDAQAQQMTKLEELKARYASEQGKLTEMRERNTRAQNVGLPKSRDGPDRER
ncbi:MAG: relaxase [Ponticaulis sp.]|nr:relaxase [Ponticaulis sp.]|tara:strand:+ start:4452 stop:5777 length:1326 start_codon:yes stop_codon:yes gene_type:complete